MDAVVEPVSDPARRVAPGGWRRAAVGIALGAAAGALVVTVLPRDGSRPTALDRARDPGEHRAG